MADSRLSDLDATTTLGPNDLVYVVRNGVSKKMTVSSLLANFNAPIINSGITTVLAGEKTVTVDGGVASAPWFTFDNSKYDFASVDFVARDTTTSYTHAYGFIHALAKNGTVDWYDSDVHSELLEVPQADVTNTTSVNLRIRRTDNATANINIRWRITLFNK